MISSTLLALCLSVSVLSTPLSTNPSYTPPRRAPLVPAPIIEADHPHGTIPNSYIVVLKPDVPVSLIANHFNFLQAAHQADPLSDVEGGLRHVYDGLLNGYAGMFSPAVLAQIQGMPEVDFIERDQIVRTQNITTQSGVTTQIGAPWGLARISKRPRLRFGTFTTYDYESDGGDGVDVYVIDTGINIHHTEFGGRAKWGKTIPLNDEDVDGNGHGSHCAGTIASSAYGVAKKANVIAVKVLGSNGSGSMQDVIGGVDWAYKAASAKAAAAEAEYKATGRAPAHKGSVANMSLGGGKSPGLDRAVNSAVKNGLHFAVAAGNDNKDACNYSPAAAEAAVTVGASTIKDERAYFSNWGPCVDVFAPGLDILSTYKGDKDAVARLSGTSMASPHVAGLMAYFLSLYGKSFQPKISEMPLPSPLNAAPQRIFSSSFYSIAHAALPPFISSRLPSPRLFSAVVHERAETYAPIPKLTPKAMKEAVIALSSPGLLTDIPEKTINLLVFNNVTESS